MPASTRDFLHLVFGQPRFSDHHRWEEVLRFFPPSLDGKVTIETVGYGRLTERLRAGDRAADVVVPIMSPVTATDMDAAGIRLIQQFGAGYEAIDVDAARQRGIPVANMPGIGAVHVAEHAMALVLGLARRLPDSRDGFRPDAWGTPGGVTLAGSTACVIGMGAIGRAIARRLQAFGVTVIGTYRSRIATEDIPAGVELHPASELGNIAPRVDIVMIAASHARTAPPVVSRAVLAKLRPGALVVNVARGSVMDNDAALDLLNAGTIGGLGLDVFPIEPYPHDGPLLHPRVIATSHTAALTTGFFETASRTLGEAIAAVARGDAPRHQIVRFGSDGRPRENQRPNRVVTPGE
jgi:phosphoglycerate dehydrogenase-like enzyme